MMTQSRNYELQKFQGESNLLFEIYQWQNDCLLHDFAQFFPIHSKTESSPSLIDDMYDDSSRLLPIISDAVLELLRFELAVDLLALLLVVSIVRVRRLS